MSDDWYWCLTHGRAEQERDDPDNALGPYPSAEAARDWKSRRDQRESAWDDDEEKRPE